MFKRVPPALLDEARERSFPVLAVPMSTAFRDIIGFVNRSSLSSDLRTYQRLTAIQRHLVDALREAHPREAMVQRLARMLDAGVLLLDDETLTAGPTPDPERVRRRVAEREFEQDGWHVVAVPIGSSGWLAVTARGRHTARLARPAAQAAVPLLAATERLSELAREQERALRAALLDEILERAGDPRGWRPRASFGVTFPARVVARGAGGWRRCARGSGAAAASARRRPPARAAPRADARRGCAPRRGLVPHAANAPRAAVALVATVPDGAPAARSRSRRRAALAARRRARRARRAWPPTRTSTCRRCCSPRSRPSGSRRASTRCSPRCRAAAGGADAYFAARWTSTPPRTPCTCTRTRCATGSGASSSCWAVAQGPGDDRRVAPRAVDTSLLSV